MSEHLSTQQIERYHGRAMQPAELLVADDHLTSCGECRQRLRQVEPVAETLISFRAEMALQARSELSHLAYEQLAVFVDDELDEIDREIIEGHLEMCPQCQAEAKDLRELRGLMTAYPTKEYAPVDPATWSQKLRAFLRVPVLWRRIATVGMAAAAALIVFWAGVTLLTTGESAKTGSVGDALQRENNRLRGQATVAQGLQSRVALLQAEQAQAKRENALLREENQRLRQVANRLKPTPIAPLTPPGQPATKVRLKDGGGELAFDGQGKLVRIVPLPSTVEQTLKSRRVRTPAILASLIGQQGRLMGGTDPDVPFALVSPIATVVRSTRPTFRWIKFVGATSYTVTVFDTSYNQVAQGNSLSITEWRPPRDLQRGRIYTWQVSALKDGQEVTSPTPPAPEAKFKVLEPAPVAELARAQQKYAGSHLTLGILYAGAGLLDEAEQEFGELTEANPQSPVAQNLLRSVQALRKSADRAPDASR